jgi:hypothetical protein
MHLEKPKAKPDLITEYHKFVTEVGKQIVDTMTVNWHQHIAPWIGPSNIDTLNYNLNYNLKKKIREKWNDAATVTENEKLKSLKNMFLTKVNAMKTYHWISFIEDTYDMQSLAIQIYEICKGDDAEICKCDYTKQLAFFLDIFVANLIGIEMTNGSKCKGPLWEMRTKIEP